jgi:hypothetical protein
MFFFSWCKEGEFSFTFGRRQGLVGIREWAENQKRNALPLKLENRCVFHSIQVNIVSYSYILFVISSLVLIHVQHCESSCKFVKHYKNRFMFPCVSTSK